MNFNEKKSSLSLRNSYFSEFKHEFDDMLPDPQENIINETIFSGNFNPVENNSNDNFTLTFDTDMTTSNSLNCSDNELLKHTIEVTVIYCFGYFVIFVLGIFGNCFVVAVVARSPRMRTVTNYFIVNLALADILVIIFCLPATLVSSIFTRK